MALLPKGQDVQASQCPSNSEPAATANASIVGMAHEIKNSLVAVKTLVELLLEREPKLEMARIVRHEIDRINSIVGQMLRSAGPPQARFERVHAHPVVEMCLQLLRSQTLNRPIQIHGVLEAVTDELWADRDQLEQALLNLGLNSLEAMPAQGHLTFHTQLRPGPRTSGSPTGSASQDLMWVVSVKDTGPGIPQENLDRLFEEFFTTKNGGTGLGLSITRKIVSAHGGFIEVRSQMNEGTTFELWFPLAPNAKQL